MGFYLNKTKAVAVMGRTHVLTLAFLLALAIASALATGGFDDGDDEVTVTTTVRKSNCGRSGGGSSGSGRTSTSTRCGDQCEELRGRLERMEPAYEENRLTLCGAGTKDLYRVKDSQFSASTKFHHSIDHSARQARLFNELEAGAWVAARTKDADYWIQLDLLEDKFVYGVVTQARLKHGSTSVSRRTKFTGANGAGLRGEPTNSVWGWDKGVCGGPRRRQQDYGFRRQHRSNQPRNRRVSAPRPSSLHPHRCAAVE